MREARADPGSCLGDYPLSNAGFGSYALHRAQRRRACRPSHIAKGDKVVMWYISGNRDEDKIERADEFIIDRAKPRQHLAFGAGIHRCVGDRLAEQQSAFSGRKSCNAIRFEIMGSPQRLYSNFIRGIRSLPVRIVN